MAKLTTAEFIEAIKELSVLELNDLVKACEEEFGVSAAAGVVVAAAGAAGSVTVAAPMPGKILAVKASVGQAVKKGDVIMVLEAMKMENDIVAPQDGTIASVNAALGDYVESGATLATMN